MNVVLPYGEKTLNTELPANLLATPVTANETCGVADEREEILKSLRSPIGCKPLCEFVKPTDKVGFIFNDITRYTPNQLLLDAIFEEIPFVSPKNITLFNALGSHRPNTGGEIERLLGPEYSKKFQIIQNDAFDESTQIFLGISSCGHEIWINRELMNCDVKILLGVIEPHFFAGFSGGGKSILPGMAGIKTIHHNHGFPMISDPSATWGITQSNPIWEEISESAGKISGVFLVNITLNKDREITGVFCGDLNQAYKMGCQYCKQTMQIPVREPFDIVITSNSGFPLDQNLYQSVKGISAAAQITRSGGAIIITAECREGIPGGSGFEEIMASSSTIEGVLQKIKDSSEIKQDQWQAQILLEILLDHEVYLYSKNLTDEQISSMHLKPCRNLSKTLSQLATKLGKDCQIASLPEGPQSIPYLVDPAS